MTAESSRRILPGLPAPSQRSVLFVWLGVFAVIASSLPCFDFEPPPPLAVDPARATLAELLTLRGVGPKRAREIIEDRDRAAVEGLKEQAEPREGADGPR